MFFSVYKCFKAVSGDNCLSRLFHASAERRRGLTSVGEPAVRERVRSEPLQPGVSGEQCLKAESRSCRGRTVTQDPCCSFLLRPTPAPPSEARPSSPGCGNVGEPTFTSLSSASFSGDIQHNLGYGGNMEVQFQNEFNQNVESVLRICSSSVWDLNQTTQT